MSKLRSPIHFYILKYQSVKITDVSLLMLTAYCHILDLFLYSINKYIKQSYRITWEIILLSWIKANRSRLHHYSVSAISHVCDQYGT